MAKYSRPVIQAAHRGRERDALGICAGRAPFGILAIHAALRHTTNQTTAGVSEEGAGRARPD